MTEEQIQRLVRIEEGVNHIIKIQDRDRKDHEELKKRVDLIEPKVLENTLATKIGRGILWLFSAAGVTYLFEVFRG